jgi:hypothetical protein
MKDRCHLDRAAADQHAPFAVALLEPVEVAAEGDRGGMAVEPAQPSNDVGFAMRRIAIDFAQVIGDVVTGHVEIGLMTGIGPLRIVGHPVRIGPVLVDAFRPPAGGDLLAVLAIARAAFAHDTVENVLPIFQISHRAQQFGLVVLVHRPLLRCRSKRRRPASVKGQTKKGGPFPDRPFGVFEIGFA